MKKRIRKLLSILLLITIVISNSFFVFAADLYNLDDVIEDTARYVYKTVEKPKIGSIGGEWAVLGLARSNYNVKSDYFEDYYRSIEEHLRRNKGKLHDKKYTEYSRVILALTAIGKDPRNVSGYDLTEALADYNATSFQGVNGPIWALIALDSAEYKIPKNSEAKIQANRDMYIQMILDRQLEKGGWTLFNDKEGRTLDPDVTGMALQALSKYRGRKDVDEAIKKALNALSRIQLDNGGFKSWDSENSESTVQVMVALGELGIPLNDKRFVKNGKSLLDNLLDYYIPSEGFMHTKDNKNSNQMATEQALYGLVSAQRFRDGKNSLYDMSDIEVDLKNNSASEDKRGLIGKNKNVNFMPRKADLVTFKDINESNINKNAIETLASKGIVNGKSKDLYKPYETMTRAEFATIVVRSLGLDFAGINKFKDVDELSWYKDYVSTANYYNIVNGTGNGKFNPQGTITREEAALMIMRASKLAGIGQEFRSELTRDILSQFDDYIHSEKWSREGLAFLYSEGILSSESIKIYPKKLVTRAEMAEIIYNMLNRADLI